MTDNKLTKPGMKRLRDGSIGCVPWGVPEWLGSDFSYPVHLCFEPTRGLVRDLRTLEGLAVRGNKEPGDIVEHLSDEIADPRTWTPPVVLNVGVWEDRHGIRRAVLYQNQNGYWYAYSPNEWAHYFQLDGTTPSKSVPNLAERVGDIVDGWWL